MNTQQTNTSNLTINDWLNSNPLKHGKELPPHGQFKYFKKKNNKVVYGIITIKRRTRCRIHWEWNPVSPDFPIAYNAEKSSGAGNKIYVGSHSTEYFNLVFSSIYPKDLFPMDTVAPEHFKVKKSPEQIKDDRIKELEEQLELLESENNQRKEWVEEFKQIEWEMEIELELEKAINKELIERQDLMETENKELKARLDEKTQEAEAYRKYLYIDFMSYSNVDERSKRLNDFVKEKGINFVPFCEKNNECPVEPEKRFVSTQLTLAPDQTHELNLGYIN